MGHTISFGIQKGGVGKTTTTAITSFLLAKQGHKVLAVDFDSQGNLTQFLTLRNIYEFSGKTILEAVKAKNAKEYIHQVDDNLHLLPAEDLLSTFSRYLYREYKGSPAHLLKETLATVKNEYDFILIDLPPNLGDQTINGLVASDYTVVMLQSEPFCLDALDRYLETLTEIKKEANPDLVLAGILTALLDSRTSIDSAILTQAKTDYENVVFDSVIKRKNRIKEFTLTGITDHLKADKEALKIYDNFVKELKERVQEKGNGGTTQKTIYSIK